MESRKPVIVTAPAIYNNSLVKALKEKNINTYSFPVLETLIYNNPLFDQVFESIASYDYIILPSKTAIKSFIEQINKRHLDLSEIKAQFIAIGKDYDYLQENHFTHIAKPQEPSTQGIID